MQKKKTVLLQVQRKEIESHLQEAVRPHVDLAFAKLTSTQEELKRSQDLTSKLNEKFKDLERQLKLFEAKFNDQQLIIRRLSSNDRVEKVNALERKVGTFQTQLEKRAAELEDRVETVEMILKDDSKKVDSLEKSFQLPKGPLNPMQRINQEENTFMDFDLTPLIGEICFEIDPGVWRKELKIERFSLRAENMRWSNPFFLGEKGYKVKFGVHIAFPSSTIRFHFVIMKSENDVILPWPFFNLVTYKVIELNWKHPRGLQHMSATLRPDDLKINTLKSLQRPILEENPPWSHFYVIPPLKRCYSLNNTIIIEVVIGPRCKN